MDETSEEVTYEEPDEESAHEREDLQRQVQGAVRSRPARKCREHVLVRTPKNMKVPNVMCVSMLGVTCPTAKMQATPTQRQELTVESCIAGAYR